MVTVSMTSWLDPSEQTEALDYLQDVAGEDGVHLRFRQEPGDILFLNNFVVFHSRKAFENIAPSAASRSIFGVSM